MHPHVAPVLAAQFREPPYFIVMPRLTGETVAARLAAEPRLPLHTALRIARQAAEGLAALHALGYRHGDVKPANIFIGRAGHVTVIDLGFAQRSDEPDTAVDRLVLGTINYLAPELLTSTLCADWLSDVYSLGVVLFEMLAGRPPLVAESLADLIRLHQAAAAAEPPRALRPDISSAASQLVRTMLAKEPLRRPQSMADLVSELVALEIDSLDAMRHRA